MKLPHFALAGLVLLIAVGIYLTLQSDMDGKVEELKANFERENDRRERDLKDKIAAANADAKAAADRARELAGAAPGAAKIKPSGAPVPGDDPSVASALENVKSSIADNTGTAPATGVPEILEKEQDIINSTGVGTERIAADTAKVTGVLPEELDAEALSNLQSLILAQPRIARVEDARPGDNTDFIVLDEGLNKGLATGDRFAIRRGTAIVARIQIGQTVLAAKSVADVVPGSLVAGMVIKPGDDVIKFDR